MADGLGYNFSPDQQKRLRNNLNAPGQGGLSPTANEAIKVLSLRLPNVLGGMPLGPETLLKQPMGGTMAPAVMPSGTPAAPGSAAAPAGPAGPPLYSLLSGALAGGGSGATATPHFDADSITVPSTPRVPNTDGLSTASAPPVSPGTVSDNTFRSWLNRRAE